MNELLFPQMTHRNIKSIDKHFKDEHYEKENLVKNVTNEGIDSFLMMNTLKKGLYLKDATEEGINISFN